MLDALHGADRIVGVDVRAVGSRAADEKVRHGRGRLAAAQDFEAPEGGALAQRVILAARQHGVDQRPGCLLAGALPRKHLLAYSAKGHGTGAYRTPPYGRRLHRLEAGRGAAPSRSFSNRRTGFQPVISGFWNNWLKQPPPLSQIASR